MYDQFEDGSAVLGGAPFNVAWHLQGLGMNPLLVSRVGEDALGKQALDTIQGWGMDLRGIQRDPSHATGRVAVSLREGQPSYRILPDQAYDFIAPAPARAAVTEISTALLYHGTLAGRRATSLEALRALRDLDLPTFVDVNLRAPWWRHPLVDELIARARWLKLNDQELVELCPERDPERAAQSLFERHGPALLVVTRGAQGATLIWADGRRSATPPVPPALVDTVGAGDAFSAVVIMGLLANWPVEVLLARALEFASAVCGIRGAITDDPRFYAGFLRRWGR